MSECYYCDGRGHVPTSGGDLDVECPVCYGDGMAIPDPGTTTRAERQVAAVRDVLEGVARLRDEYSYKPFRVEESPFARGLDIAMDRLTRALETE